MILAWLAALFPWLLFFHFSYLAAKLEPKRPPTAEELAKKAARESDQRKRIKFDPLMLDSYNERKDKR